MDGELLAEIAADPKAYKKRLLELKKADDHAKMALDKARTDSTQLKMNATKEAEAILLKAEAELASMKEAVADDIAKRMEKARTFETVVNARHVEAENLMQSAAKRDTAVSKRERALSTAKDKFDRERDEFSARVKAVNEAWSG